MKQNEWEQYFRELYANQWTEEENIYNKELTKTTQAPNLITKEQVMNASSLLKNKYAQGDRQLIN